MRKIIVFLMILVIFGNCEKRNISKPSECPNKISLESIQHRSFKMGFSTWSFGPEQADVNATYEFITNNADIYAEQIDDRIPWSAWMNDTELPVEFVNDIEFRVSKKIPDHKLLLSVSFLNALRNDIVEDFDEEVPPFIDLNDKAIEDAYFKHLSYLVNKFQPDYLVLAMEVNELWLHSESKWNEYKLLMQNIRQRMKEAYPLLKLSESVTLHNWFVLKSESPEGFAQGIADYIAHLDFVAISFYPFIVNLNNQNEFQAAFEFLNKKVNKPIAIVETSHLAEDLSIPEANLFIPGTVCEQKEYVETLLLNAHNNNYEFVLWWSFRDYDKLLNSFPEELRLFGRTWQDTGLVDEDGNERPGLEVWKDILAK